MSKSFSLSHDSCYHLTEILHEAKPDFIALVARNQLEAEAHEQPQDIHNQLDRLKPSGLLHQGPALDCAPQPHPDSLWLLGSHSHSQEHL